MKLSNEDFDFDNTKISVKKLKKLKKENKRLKKINQVYLDLIESFSVDF